MMNSALTSGNTGKKGELLESFTAAQYGISKDWKVRGERKKVGRKGGGHQQQVA